MELRQIKYFIEVANREHVTEAAIALHVAQSAVSRQIFNLESELGVDLFIREGRNVRLTPIGRIFLEHMEQAIHVIDDAKQVIDEYTDPEKGTIHIGFPSSLATYILPTAISAFREEYPDVKFQLNQGSYHELKTAVIKGEINMALLGPLPMNEKKLKGAILFTENIVGLLPATHPLANSSSLKLNQLREESFVLFPKEYVLRDLITNACQQIGFKPNVSFEGQDIDSIKGLVSAGLGVSLVPEITLVDNLPRATVKVTNIDPNITRTVGVVIPKDRKLLPTEKLFYEFLLDFFTRLEKFQN
ncbi:LysR family transcriptional regulator [Virgibacillus profundi]|uniref:LysR family transcriptional regulator n=1 Tax=Virgibacillus profundi TaxID=2024555 RepID=A0A2A2IIP9_9BACI|nr:LysR family transcriptional regulator [Virgibacillus profundi]PAV31507.1 LysR family transcriptional regulator [Virgibacillus profundi]PXY55693.1 LysR family transcriptional regulator [Virgibacillus profundi]